MTAWRLRRHVTRAARGDEEAAGSLFDHYYPRVYRYARAMLGDSSAAEDVAAETFAVVLSELAEFKRRPGRFETWIFRSARSLIADSGHDRVRGRLSNRPRDEGVYEDTPEAALVALEASSDGDEMLRDLSGDEVEVALLRFAGGVTSDDAARILGRRPVAVQRMQLSVLQTLTKNDHPVTEDQRSKSLAAELDRALRGGRMDGDPDTAAPAAAARFLEGRLAAEAPAAEHERILFTIGVGAQKRPLTPTKALAPIVAVAMVAFVVVFLSRDSNPGDILYPVHKALGSVGLADSPVKLLDRSLGRAENDLVDAERLLARGALRQARDQAADVIVTLTAAADLLAELERADRIELRAEIDDFQDRAVAVVVAAARPRSLAPSDDRRD